MCLPVFWMRSPSERWFYILCGWLNLHTFGLGAAVLGCLVEDIASMTVGLLTLGFTAALHFLQNIRTPFPEHETYWIKWWAAQYCVFAVAASYGLSMITEGIRGHVIEVAYSEAEKRQRAYLLDACEAEYPSDYFNSLEDNRLAKLKGALHEVEEGLEQGTNQVKLMVDFKNEVKAKFRDAEDAEKWYTPESSSAQTTTSQPVAIRVEGNKRNGGSSQTAASSSRKRSSDSVAESSQSTKGHSLSFPSSSSEVDNGRSGSDHRNGENVKTVSEV